MQPGGGNAPSEVASHDEFMQKINSLKSGTFPLGRNRIWHGGIHLSEKGGWHSSGAVRAIADGEIVAYRLATNPAKVTISPEEGKPGQDLDVYTSCSFCLVRHRYEAGEQSKNHLTFYSLYMHIACENTYNSPQMERVTVKGNDVFTYESVAEGIPLKLRLRVKPGGGILYATAGVEVTLLQQVPSNLLNHKSDPLACHLVHYVSDPDSVFYIAASQLQQDHPAKPGWMIPQEGKPERHRVPGNTWLRRTATTTEGSLGLPTGSEVLVSPKSQMVITNGGLTEFRRVLVFQAAIGSVKDSDNRIMVNASKAALGWLEKSKIGAALAAESSPPIQFEEEAPVVDRSENPIAVQAGEIIGHWGEHQLATSGASGFTLDPDQKAVHFEVFVAEKDKQALVDCIKNKARVTAGQGYLVLKEGAVVTSYRLTTPCGYDSLSSFGPITEPLAVKESDIVSHGANQFVRVREQLAIEGALSGEFVLLAGDAEIVSQFDWGKLGVKLVNGSDDVDGFLDKADIEGQHIKDREASPFFCMLFEQLVTNRANDVPLSSDEVKLALADVACAGRLHRLFIKHESEWIKRDDWPRLKKVLANQPNLYRFAMKMQNTMAWVEDVIHLLGDAKPWFIHPAGLFSLVQNLNEKPSTPLSDTLSHEDLEWIQEAVLQPARSVRGACVLTSAGIFTYLNGGGRPLADTFFLRVRDNIKTGKNCAMSTDRIIRDLVSSQMNVTADVYMNETDRWVCVHGKLVENFPEIIREHPFNIDVLRDKLFTLPSGQCQILFVDNYHALALARDDNSWYLFDTGLNIDKDFYMEKDQNKESALNVMRQMSPHTFTPSGNKYATDNEAKEIVNGYLKEIKRQPVIITVANA